LVISTIDRSSPIPIYYQIAMDIRQRITKGEWKVDNQIPPEPEMAAQYQVSRMTIRQALAHVEKDGILTRLRGSGTFINHYPNRVVPSLGFPMSFTYQVRELGITPAVKIIKAEVIKVPTLEIAVHLSLLDDAEVARFTRVFFADDKPVALSTSILPHHVCLGITTTKLINDSLSTTLAEQYGLIPTQVDQWLGATNADPQEAELLNVQPGSPLLYITTLGHLANGTPIEYALTSCVGDRLQLHIHVVSGEEDSPTSAMMETITIQPS